MRPLLKNYPGSNGILLAIFSLTAEAVSFIKRFVVSITVTSYDYKTAFL